MTRFAAMPQRVAIAIILVIVASSMWLISFAWTAAKAPFVRPEHGDSDAYFDILKIMRGGADYYSAAHEILLSQGFGTTSVFNWRTPAWPVFLAHLPSVEWAQAALALLVLFALLLAYRMNRIQGNLVLAGATIPCLLSSVALLAELKSIVLTEIAAGILILFSVVSYGNGRSMIGLIAAMAALFIRELAAPYILVCIAFAIYQKNTRELVGWALGLFAYFAYFLLHWFEVEHQWGASERAYNDGWIRFGGIRFILETAHFNGIFVLFPLWLTAVLLPAALTGLFAWRSGLRAALTVTTYLCFFAVAGKPFNYYWGALYAPVLMLGLPWSIPAMYDTLALRGSTTLGLRIR